MSTRSLSALSHAALPVFLEFEKRLHALGIAFVRACTYRSSDEQGELFKQGRDKPGNIVTWAQGGQSPHNTTSEGYPASTAGDYYPLLNGKLADNHTMEELALWELVAVQGRACGLEWGGDWTARKKDYPHFQLPKGV